MNNILTSNNNFTSGSLLPIHKVSLHDSNMLSIPSITTPFWAMIYPQLPWGIGGHKCSRSKKGRFSTFWPVLSFPMFVFQAFLTWALHFTYDDLLIPQNSSTSAPSSLESPSRTPHPLFIFITMLQLIHLIWPNWVPTFTILSHSNPVNCLISGSHLYRYLVISLHIFIFSVTNLIMKEVFHLN